VKDQLAKMDWWLLLTGMIYSNFLPFFTGLLFLTQPDLFPSLCPAIFNSAHRAQKQPFH